MQKSIKNNKNMSDTAKTDKLKVGDKISYENETVEIYSIRKDTNGNSIKFYAENSKNEKQYSINSYDMKELLDNGKIKILPSDQPKASNISDIHIFSLKTGGFAIRCKIDGEQQSAEKMTREDVMNFTDKTDRFQLANKYFQSALQEQKQEISVKR